MRFGTDWGRGSGGPGDFDLDERQRNEAEEDWQTMRKLQFTVATSTFSVIAFVGMFCTCLYFGCCRHKRHTRIRGKTWSTNTTFATPVSSPPIPGQLGHLDYNYNHNHNILDPNGLTLNPYLINNSNFSHFVLDPQGNANGYYHPQHLNNQHQHQMQTDLNTDQGQGQGSTEPPPKYKPFFTMMDWQPPDPPSYQSLNLRNLDKRLEDSTSQDKELIEEKIPTSILQTPDPTKVTQVTRVAKIKEGGKVTETPAPKPEDFLTSFEARFNTNINTNINTATSGGKGQSEGQGQQNDLNQPTSEELKPPPFNPGYLSYLNR